LRHNVVFHYFYLASLQPIAADVIVVRSVRLIVCMSVCHTCALRDAIWQEKRVIPKTTLYCIYVTKLNIRHRFTAQTKKMRAEVLVQKY